MRYHKIFYSYFTNLQQYDKTNDNIKLIFLSKYFSSNDTYQKIVFSSNSFFPFVNKNNKYGILHSKNFGKLNPFCLLPIFIFQPVHSPVIICILFWFLFLFTQNKKILIKNIDNICLWDEVLFSTHYRLLYSSWLLYLHFGHCTLRSSKGTWSAREWGKWDGHSSSQWVNINNLFLVIYAIHPFSWFWCKIIPDSFSETPFHILSVKKHDEVN